MTHYVDIAMLRQEDNNSEYGFGVFAKDADKSVLQGHGRPLCLSPDGRYMVLQQEKNSAMLFDLTGQSTPCEFTAAENKYYQYMQAAFSDDGKWLAVNVSPEMELVSMTEGFPRKKLPKSGSWIGFPVHFSPDGTRILCRGGDRAFLYDTEKGTLLQTFVEPERFLPMYEYSGSVWNNILTSAKEWAGLVTDTFKSVNGLECTFTGNGTRVITYASGQVIRVWDSSTGQRLQTIYTKLPEKRDERGQIRNEITFSKNGDYAFAFNQDGFSTASLWSVSDGILLRRYQLPGGINTWTQVVVSDDGAVYIISDGDLNRWAGRKTDGL
jgi:WD40 repeat protein